MAISGIAVGNQSEITPEVLDRFYAQDDMHGLAEQFADVARAGLTESVDIFGEPSKFFMTPSLKNQMKKIQNGEMSMQQFQQYSAMADQVIQTLYGTGRRY